MLGKTLTTGPERAIIENMLDHNREALIETVRGLSEADAHRRLVASLTTPISLIKHAAAAERIWFQRFWAGLSESDCDGYSRRDEGTFAVTDDDMHPRPEHRRLECPVLLADQFEGFTQPWRAHLEHCPT